MMFGFACNDTDELMPLPIALAHRIINRITDLRQDGTIKWLRPDAKSQVTIEYDGYTPIRVDTVVVSTQHAPEVSHAEIVKTITEQVIQPVLPADLLSGSPTYHINPTGKFVIGGPHGDSGVTGRKIIVDTYGGMGRHGGGAFSGKDPTKVDRSAAYMARYVAKNIVAARLADRCEIHSPMPLASPNRSASRRYTRDRDVARLDDRRVGAQALSAQPVGYHLLFESSPADLSKDCQRRPLRPFRAGVYLGKDRQGACLARSSKFIRPINDSLRAAVSTAGSPSRPWCEDVPERS